VASKKSKKSKRKSGDTKGREGLAEVAIADQQVLRGAGGETHQVAGSDDEAMTTAQGVIVADGQHTLTVGPRGPQLLEDFVMREKIFHFDHERIPERVVHARGYGAKGYFENYENQTDLTWAIQPMVPSTSMKEPSTPSSPEI